VDHTKDLTHISLCSGYGGIDLGLKRAIRDVRTVAYSEIGDFACANLVSKIEAGWLDNAPIWTDLKTFPWAEFRGKVDIISGGFPCQPFSAAGRKAGDEDERHLWPHIVRGIRELERPPIVFFENVEGILSSNLKGDDWSDPQGTPVLLHVFRELERLGYRTTAGVFSASEVGAPHQRKRIFILGVRADLSDAGRSRVGELLAHADIRRSEPYALQRCGICREGSRPLVVYRREL
jgi:DNA (cytosine-5)-methyltransferase 1